MTLNLTVSIKGIQNIIDELKAVSANSYAGQYVYPIFINRINTTLTMIDLTEILISQSKGDFVYAAISKLTEFTDEAFQSEIFKVLEGWGQNPQLSTSALYQRKKAKVGATPRNVITGDFVRCFGLGFSKTLPADIPVRDWIRKL